MNIADLGLCAGVVSLQTHQVRLSDRAAPSLTVFLGSKNQQKVKLNSKRDKLKFSFRMYDLDGDGQISKDELFTVLEQMVEGIDPEELRRISERFITEIDISDVSNETYWMV